MIEELHGPKVQVIPPTPLQPVDLSDPSNINQLRRARELLQNPDPPMKVLLRFNKDTLRALCDERNISYPGKSQKLDLVEKLFTAVSYAAYKLYVTSNPPLRLAGLSSVQKVLSRRRA